MAMASPPPVEVDLGKLSYEIFSLLESNFLFGAAAGGGGGGGGGVCSLPGTPGRAVLGAGGGGGRVRVLTIDGCGRGPGDALLAAAALVRLETALREKAGDGDVRVADFFDAAAGAGAGGVLAAMLFLKGPDGRPSPPSQIGRLSSNRFANLPGAASPACSTKALSSLDVKKAAAIADGMLTQRNVEAELFRGRRLSEKSNREKLDAFAAELVKEQDRRRASPGLPNVVIKQASSATPTRLSSATTASSVTGTTATARTAVSSMPSPAAALDSDRH
uniref:PNPLA domain-containing protein n=1 Tax=Oryza brachyantha TaxID=4533 RepID=J3NEW5_ORYBR